MQRGKAEGWPDSASNARANTLRPSFSPTCCGLFSWHMVFCRAEGTGVEMRSVTQPAYPGSFGLRALGDEMRSVTQPAYPGSFGHRSSAIPTIVLSSKHHAQENSLAAPTEHGLSLAARMRAHRRATTQDAH
jgi:hypothetical protein